MPRRAQPPDPAERARILEATHRLIAEHGPHDVKLADIARAAGVAYGTLYRHFTNREALLLETMLEQSVEVEQQWRAAAEGADDPVDQIVAICLAPMQIAAANPRSREIYGSAMRGGHDAVPGAAARYQEMAALVLDQLEKAILDAQLSGWFPTSSARVLAVALFGMPATFLSDLFAPDEPDWPAAMAEVESVIRAVAADGTTDARRT